MVEKKTQLPYLIREKNKIMPEADIISVFKLKEDSKQLFFMAARNRKTRTLA